MTRLAIFGNSHLGALRTAWDQRDPGAQGDIAPTFFGAPRDTIVGLTVADGTLVPSNPQLEKFLALSSGVSQSTIDLAEYDHVLIHGLVSRNWVYGTSRRFAEYMHRSDAYLTGGLLRDVAVQLYEDGACSALVRLVRRVSSLPITVSPQPYLSEDSPHHADLPAMLERVGEAAEMGIAAHLAADSIGYLPQPGDTTTHWCFTRRDFGVGGRRLLGEDYSSDTTNFSHMNEAYGERVMDHVVANFVQTSASAL